MLIRFQKILLGLTLVLLPSQISYHLWPEWSYVAGLPIDYLAPTLYVTDILIYVFIATQFRDITRLFFNTSKSHKFFTLVLIFLVAANCFLAKVAPITIYMWIRLGEYLMWGAGMYLFFKKTSFSISPFLIFSLVWTVSLQVLQLAQQQSVGGVWSMFGERPLSPVQLGVSKVAINTQEIVLRPYATFPHPNVLAGYSGAVALLVKIKHPILNKLFLLISSLSIIATFSRSVSMAYIPLVAIKTRLYKYTVASLVLVVLLAIIGSRLTFAQKSFSERIYLNMSAIKIIVNHPVFGVGLGNFITQLPNTADLKTNNHQLILQPVHNIYMLLLAELGLLIPGVFGISIAFRAKKVWQKLNRNHKLAILLVSITGLTDHYWITAHQTQLLLVILVVACLKSAHDSYESKH